MSEQILSISTFVERHTIDINGTSYEVRNRDELSLIEFARVKQVEKLKGLSVDSMSPEDASQLAQAVEVLVMILLPDLAPDVLAALPDLKRIEIVNAWASKQPKEEVVPGNRQSRRTGAASSRGSRATTAGHPKAG